MIHVSAVVYRLSKATQRQLEIQSSLIVFRKFFRSKARPTSISGCWHLFRLFWRIARTTILECKSRGCCWKSLDAGRASPGCSLGNEPAVQSEIQSSRTKIISVSRQNWLKSINLPALSQRITCVSPPLASFPQSGSHSKGQRTKSAGSS